MMSSLRRCALIAILLPTAACRTGGSETGSALLDTATPCGDVQVYTLEPLPGQTPGQAVSADGGGNARVVADRLNYFFRYCASTSQLLSVASLEDQSGQILLENSASARFSAVEGVTQAFAEGQSQSLRVLLESRNLRVTGAAIGGAPVVLVGVANPSPFSQRPVAGRLVRVATMPRPAATGNEPQNRSAFLRCDAGSEVVSLNAAGLTSGTDSVDLQMDACLGSDDSVGKAALLAIVKSEWNGQVQTDIIEIPGAELANVADIAFGSVTATTRVVFTSATPLGRNQIRSAVLAGTGDGELTLKLDERAATAPFTMEVGALSAAGKCRPGEELVRSSIRFEPPSGTVNVSLVGCRNHEFGATGTTQYNFKEIEVTDAGVAGAPRRLVDADLAARSKLVVTHHNSCDKLEIRFDDVEYGFTSPETFSFGNECQEDLGIAPPNPARDQLAVRRRVTSGGATDSLTLPWGKGLIYLRKVTLTEGSDPLD